VLATALNPLVTVLIKRSEVLPQLFLLGRSRVVTLHRGELAREKSEGVDMEFVLVRLHNRQQAPGYKAQARNLTFRLPSWVKVLLQLSSLQINGLV